MQNTIDDSMIYTRAHTHTQRNFLKLSDLPANTVCE